MTDANLKALYRETVLTHSRQPHNFRRLETADRQAEGHNRLCGDKLTVYLALADEHLDQVTFEGTGCAIAMASASIMTDAVTGKSLREAGMLVAQVLDAFTPGKAEDGIASLGEMAALAGVRAYPSRVKCATLAWQTLSAALRGARDTVSTETQES
jgi:nitrogen fixation NifU-like protein